MIVMMPTFYRNVAHVEIDSELDINLRSTCLACKFLANCPVAEERSAPDKDVLLGSYRFRALKERCLV